jgi:hypothetical protein
MASLQLLVKGAGDQVTLLHVQQKGHPGGSTRGSSALGPETACSNSQTQLLRMSAPAAHALLGGQAGGGQPARRAGLTRFSALGWLGGPNSSSPSEKSGGRSTAPEGTAQDGCTELLESCRQQLLAECKR